MKEGLITKFFNFLKSYFSFASYAKEYADVNSLLDKIFPEWQKYLKRRFYLMRFFQILTTISISILFLYKGYTAMNVSSIFDMALLCVLVSSGLFFACVEDNRVHFDFPEDFNASYIFGLKIGIMISAAAS